MHFNSFDQSEKLQEILEEIKKVLNSQPSDMEMVKIQNAIKEAQQKKQLTLKTFASIVEDTISKVKVLLEQKANLEKQINKKEKQLRELRKGQCVTALLLKHEVTELKQQLLETEQELNAARIQHSNELFKTLDEIRALTNQTKQLMSENDLLGAELHSKMALINCLETSTTSLIQLTANLQVSTIKHLSMHLSLCLNHTSVAQSGRGTATPAAINISNVTAGRTTRA